MLAAWDKALYLGVTATPERLDGRGLGMIFDAMVLGPSTRWLIDNRFLAKPTYYAPEKSVDLTGAHKVAGDFNRSELEELMDQPTITGDAVAHYRKFCNERTAVAFCVSVAHAEHVAEQFRKSGVTAVSIDGTLDADERKRRIKALASGDVRVLTSCELVSEGFDLPAVGAALLLRPTASLAMHLQQIGRALRPKKDGSGATILDHVGNTIRHGLAEQDREWSLEGRAARMKKETQVETKQCRKCFAIFSGTVCPECRTVPESKAREIEEVDGELKMVDPEVLAQRYQARREEGLCKTLEDFQKLAVKRGYKPGWARYRWQARLEKRR